mgnify:CR=1 FL=1
MYFTSKIVYMAELSVKRAIIIIIIILTCNFAPSLKQQITSLSVD